MTKITGKLQITLPKRVADTYGLKAGDEVAIAPAGDIISLRPVGRQSTAATPAERLRLFDATTARHQARQGARRKMPAPADARDRGWTRADLYDRGRPG